VSADSIIYGQLLIIFFIILRILIHNSTLLRNMKKIIIISLIVFTSITVFALNPRRDYPVTPAKFGLDYEEVTIQTSDKLNLHGWFYKTRSVSYKIVIISGNGTGNMSDLIEVASNFVSLGYNVLTYDYRGYGQSSDFEIDTNFYIYAQFEKDLSAAIDYVKKYHAKIKTINLYGTGIGAGLSISVGVNSSVFRIIADSPYSTLEGIKKRIKETKGIDVLLPLGYDKYMLEPFFALESKGATVNSILFIAGDNDPIYSPKDMKELAKIQKNRSKTFFVKGANNTTTFSIDKNAYFKEIKSFLQ